MRTVKFQKNKSIPSDVYFMPGKRKKSQQAPTSESAHTSTASKTSGGLHMGGANAMP